MVRRNDSPPAGVCEGDLIPRPDGAASPRILVVEDHADTREMLKTILEMQNFSVLEAVDGEAGLQVAVDEQPDLILMDLTLPHVDGLTATKAIRKRKDIGDVPIIFLSARAEPAGKTSAFEAGCNDYLTKPLKLDDVLLTVRRWLGGNDGSSENH